MAYVIIDADGEALTDVDGRTIIVATDDEAREWLMRSDQRVERYEVWIERKD